MSSFTKVVISLLILAVWDPSHVKTSRSGRRPKIGNTISGANFTIVGDFQMLSNSPSFRTPRQYGNNYPGAPLNCYYCNLYYGGNQGGGGRPPSSGFPNPNPDDGQDEDTDGLDPFEEQPDGDRVYGGFYSKLGQWPFVVEVELRNDKSCTGILHDVNTIITAAHCVVSSNGVVARDADLSVLAGAISIGRGKRRSVKSVHPHPKYKPPHLLYDIAILKVENPFVLGNTIRPIPTQQATRLPAETECILSGFGYVDGSKDEKRRDQTYARIKVRVNKLCADKYGSKDYNSNLATCGGGHGASMCYGDAGGPLHCKSPTGYGRVLYGIASFASPGTDKNQPCNNKNVGVFTRAPSFDGWIQECTAGNCTLGGKPETDNGNGGMIGYF
ncbi:kallikrein 1-related peptidase b11 [Folsomia candida]|uniref:Serine protease 56 n=1 Tax=Folsomia candida TaxID=158441 RepID=A0A226F5F5_FOLCA|nr:kallikrein 1-related peptidase b11 [Folsomia candida]OXA64580.1 Serine protease 56 [Folsomia candida]